MTPERVLGWLKGDQSAAAFVIDLRNVVEVWDDLIDKDKPVKPEDINGSFYTALVGLPRNRFYQEHFALLSPLVEAMIVDWHAANALEKSNTEAAWALRFTFISVVAMCARIIGGLEWAQSVNADLWNEAESLDDFKRGLGAK